MQQFKVKQPATRCGSLYAITYADLQPLHQGWWPPTEELGRVESSVISSKWVTSTSEKCPERHSILGGRRKLGFGYFHCFCALSRLYNLFHLQFLLILCSAIMHYLCPSTVNLTDKALSLALQERTAMIETRKIQSNLNVFPTERALLEELLHILYEKRRRAHRFNHHTLQKVTHR